MNLPGLQSCDQCPLHVNGVAVPGEGPAPCKWMFLAEAPGEEENYQGRPMVGDAGKRLNLYLELAGLKREEVFIMNSVLHWPGPGNPKPKASMVRACRPWLNRTIQVVDPDIIVCLGETAATNILGSSNLKKNHGKGFIVEVEGRARVVYTLYHPAAGLHNPSLTPTIRLDFAGLKNPPARYLEDLEVVWIRGNQIPFVDSQLLSVDLETTSLDVRTTEIVAISFSQYPGRSYVGSPSSGLIKMLRGAVKSIGTIIVHGGFFDLPILERYGVSISPDQVWDTLLSAYILGKELGLKTRALRELGVLMESFKQVAGKEKDSSRADPWRLFPYAAVDAVVPIMLYHRDKVEVRENGAEEGMWIEHHLTPILHQMHVNGIRFDRQKAESLKVELEGHIRSLEERAYDQTGVRVNLNTPEEISWLLFNKLGLKPVKRTKGDSFWSTDEEVLKERVDDHPVVSTIMEHRQFYKQKSTYVESPMEWSKQDGRVHTEFKQFGARGGRTSSVNPNLQNISQRRGWDKKIKGLYIADEGEVLISFDFSQLEMRVAAAVTEDPTLIKVFMDGRDIHDENTRMILGREPGNPDDRRLSKNIGFGLVYGMMPKGLRDYLQYKAEPPIRMSMREVIGLHRNFLGQFPVLAEAQGRWVRELHELGYVDTPIFHYRRYLPEVHADDKKVVADAERVAVNLKIQGPAGVITKLAMVRLKEYSGLFRNTVHDSLLVGVQKGRAKEVAVDISRGMCKTAEEVLGIPVEVKWEMGQTWGECK